MGGQLDEDWDAIAPLLSDDVLFHCSKCRLRLQRLYGGYITPKVSVLERWPADQDAAGDRDRRDHWRLETSDKVEALLRKYS